MRAMKWMLVVMALSTGACSDATGARQPALEEPPGTSSEAVGGSCPYPGQIAVAEICNGFDDDCDGVIDEGACSDPCDTTF
ncbi:MAG: MopE-related protein [Polyangiaceae bacterium]